MHAIVVHGHKSDKCSAEHVYSLLLDPLFTAAIPMNPILPAKNGRPGPILTKFRNQNYMVLFPSFEPRPQAPPQKIRKKVLAGRQGLGTRCRLTAEKIEP